MAHRCGFTQKVLASTMQSVGFKSVATMSRGAPYYDLWAIASKQELDEAQMMDLARIHFSPI
jgi:hypothetical protein